MPTHGAAFSQRLVVESPALVCLYLRDYLQTAKQKQGEIILDINRSGNWVRGFEIVGGFVPFSVAKAVWPFSPSQPAFSKIPDAGTVTYDPEADAAFFYLEYDACFTVLEPGEQTGLKVISHSVNPTATYGLDGSDGLAWVKIPIADISGVEQFVRLLRK